MSHSLLKLVDRLRLTLAAVNEVKNFFCNFKTAGAEPSAGFNFNIALHGDTEEEVSGTELAAEWAFSSLQKFGQEFLKKLKGKKMPNKLLEKVRWLPDYLLLGSFTHSVLIEQGSYLGIWFLWLSTSHVEMHLLEGTWLSTLFR